MQRSFPPLSVSLTETHPPFSALSDVRSRMESALYGQERSGVDLPGARHVVGFLNRCLCLYINMEIILFSLWFWSMWRPPPLSLPPGETGLSGEFTPSHTDWIFRFPAKIERMITFVLFKFVLEQPLLVPSCSFKRIMAFVLWRYFNGEVTWLQTWRSDGRRDV